MGQAASAPLHSSDMPGLRLPNLPVLHWQFLIFSAKSIPLMVMLSSVPTASWPCGAGRTTASERGGGCFGVLQGSLRTGFRASSNTGRRPSSRFYKTRFDYATGRIAVVLRPASTSATGMSRCALAGTGFPVTNTAYHKGVQFLLKSPYQDGSWFVRTRAFPLQRQLESAYPFGYNQWISAPSWASLTIARTLPAASP
jgi:hypothetical protein